MVASLFHPLNIFLLGLGGGFVIPLLYRLGKAWLHAGFWLALAGIVAVSGVSLVAVHEAGAPIEVLTAGFAPPLSINLRFGLQEGFFTFSVGLVALLGALHLWDRLKGNYGALLLYLILVMGIDGMVMTRDLFNLFVFLEIVSIATYGLLGLDRTPAAIAAAFKFIMATVVASTLFLLGTVLLYYVTGALNIDTLIAAATADHRADRRDGAADDPRLPDHRAEAVPGQWLGPRRIRDGAERGGVSRLRRRLGRRVLCAPETAASVRGAARHHRRLRRDHLPVLQSDRAEADQSAAPAWLLLDQPDGPDRLWRWRF